MKQLIIWTGLIVLLTLLGIGGYRWWQAGARDPMITSTGLIFIPWEEDLSVFSRATEPGAIEFPRDRGAHDDYQTEWWYYTGNLATKEGRRFGFQLTFFRRAVGPVHPAAEDQMTTDTPPGDWPNPSNWRTNQIYFAHFAVSDIDDDRFYHQEVFSRGAAELAGGQSEPYQVWLENWYARKIAPGVVHLYAKGKDVTINLELQETLPPVLHGDRGLSAKGPEPGNATYYYSIIRQLTRGNITVHGEDYEVAGLSWKDHEYSTSALSPGAIGWDWFSLQFDDGTALMFFQIRCEDGTLEPASSGSFIHVDGTVQHLTRGDWQLEVADTWTSTASGAVYPVGWHITIEAIDLSISGGALMSDQELTVSVTYWEGAVAFTGTRSGYPVSSEGYVEMTGYAETMAGRL